MGGQQVQDGICDFRLTGIGLGQEAAQPARYGFGVVPQQAGERLVHGAGRCNDLVVSHLSIPSILEGAVGGPRSALDVV
ncbi:hypothetical protein GTQ99_16340 [Kineococcus sp. T13]|uniref:hypothetical protein n=1 Tax=Kineococcus vitellinus TaxID=2696565 RepID=UPI001411FBD7|nr:hypothetical protein [Kineococcus vitellinus]NAZ76978.1 hypothetical protein [Kineococcus vitellinus]